MFIHPALTWGFFLALVPLLIHLINLVRRKRVKWAAMTFLLQSYKKHQKWIWLQQLLLLFLRMAAIAIAVAMLAQWVARSHWFSLFGGRVTHHYVLLDDSFSMSERFGGAAAFDKATQALARIAAQAMVQDSAQKFTLVRFSRAAGFDRESTATSIGQLADFNAETVDANFDVLLEEKRQGLTVTQLATEPRVAFELAIELVRQSQDETNVLHVLSDYRHKDWSKPAELAQLLKDLDEATEQIHFINCAPESQQGNLAITDLRPSDDIRAAGVPLFIQVTVKNFGTESVAKVPIRVRTTYYDPQGVESAEPGQPVGKVDEPPAILIEELPPGQSTTRQFQVVFPRPGEHMVQAMLPDDVVALDNQRWSVVNVEDRESVLVIESEGAQKLGSDPSQRSGAYYLQSAFEPGPRAVTGIRVVAERPAFLRDATRETLAAFRAIYLLDVDRLEDRAVENLETFVRAGGGLGIFLGDHANLGFYTNRLYRDGQGVFPLPLERAEVLPPDSEENVPDLEVVDHPLFSVLLGEQNPFIRLVNIDRYVRPPLRWSPDPNSTVAILARLRNRHPLAIEQRFGEGRVVVFLTTLAPQWNNWANDPSFVVVLLKLQSYLAAPQRIVESRLVGSPLQFPLDTEKVRRDFVFVVPGPKSDLPLILQRAATEVKSTNESEQKDDPEAVRLAALLPGTSADDANTSRPGVYELWQTTIAGPLEVRRFALNVDPVESDIQQESAQTLLSNLSPVQVRMRRADELVFDLTEQAGFSRSGWLMVLLLIALLGEQFLAYIASYHPAPLEGAARQ